MLETTTTRWWQRATGPTLLSFPTLVGFTIIGIVGIIATIPAAQISATDRLAWVGVAVVAQAALAVIVLLGRLFLRSSLTKTARVCRVVVVVLAGAVRGLLVQIVSSQVGLEDPSSFIGRVGNSAYTTLIWMVVLAIIVDAQRGYRREYRALFARDVAITSHELALEDELSLEDDRSQDPAWVVDNTLQQWTMPLRDQVDQLRGTNETDVSAGTVRETAEAIRELVTAQVRPLSHRLWFGAEGQPPRARLGPVVIEALRREPLVTWWVGILLVVGMSLGSLVRYGVQPLAVSGGSLLVVCAVYIALGQWVLGRWAHNTPGSANALLWNVTTVIPFAVLIGAVPMALSSLLLDAGADLPTFLTVVIGVPVLVLVLGVGRVTFTDRQALLSVMRDDDAFRDAVRRIREREVATYLHNHVNSQLTASALRLRDAAAGDDPEAIRAAAESAHLVLTRPIPDAIRLERRSPWDHLREVAESWDGIAEVEVDLPDDLADSTVLVIADLLAESVANSVRAGQAQWVRLTAEHRQGELIIRIIDDGVGDDGLGDDSAGMGTAWLDSLVPGRWQRRHLPGGVETGGVEVVIHLPLVEVPGS